MTFPEEDICVALSFASSVFSNGLNGDCADNYNHVIRSLFRPRSRSGLNQYFQISDLQNEKNAS